VDNTALSVYAYSASALAYAYNNAKGVKTGAWFGREGSHSDRGFRIIDQMLLAVRNNELTNIHILFEPLINNGCRVRLESGVIKEKVVPGFILQKQVHTALYIMSQYKGINIYCISPKELVDVYKKPLKEIAADHFHKPPMTAQKQGLALALHLHIQKYYKKPSQPLFLEADEPLEVNCEI